MSAILGRRRRREGNARVDVVFDSFTRADSGVSLGSTTSGHLWTPAAGGVVYGISSNQGRWVSGGAAFLAYATVDSGVADCDVFVTLAAQGVGEEGIIFRHLDVSNYWALNRNTLGTGYTLITFTGGSLVTQWTGGPAPANGDVVGVSLSGNAVTPVINGTAYTTTVLGTHATRTQHGIFTGTASGTGRYDTFRVAA